MIRIIKTVVYAIAVILLITIGYKAVNYKLDNLKTGRLQANPVTAELRQKQLDCLARNIYHEAGYEPFEGKVAVAPVIVSVAGVIVNEPGT